MDCTDFQAWAIEMVALGAGKMDTSGVFLELGQVFGSVVAQGGHESLHKISEDNLAFWTGGEFFGPRICLCMSARAIARTSNLEVRRKMLKILRDFHGKVWSLGGDGARGKVPMFRAFQRRTVGLIF